MAGEAHKIKFCAQWYEEAELPRQGDRVERLGREWVVEEVRSTGRHGFGPNPEDRDWDISLRELEPEGRDWPGQVWRDRATGRELMRRGLRGWGDEVLPARVGQLVVVEGRRYTVAAVEGDGDTVLLDLA